MTLAWRSRAGAILACSGLIQLGVAALPDTMADLQTYRAWTRTLAAGGLSAAYWPPAPAGFHLPIDYPPLFPYVLWGVGRTLAAVSAESLAHDDRLLDFLIRVPLVASLLLLGLLVRSEARRRAPGTEDFALASIVLNPALLFDTAYWGQADAPCALLLVAAIVAVVRGRLEWGWASMTAAVLVKPLAAPFIPLLALLTLRRFGGRRLVGAFAAAMAVLFLVLLPFAALGRVGDALSAFVVQLDAMPYASVDAHNLWWLATGGLPWTPSAARLGGLVPLTTVSLVLFGVFAVGVWSRMTRSADPAAPYVGAASIALGFFMLATRMHENHLFAAVPLLALAVPLPSRRFLFVFLFSATLLANMALHDPFLTAVLRPHVPGPHLLRPQQPEVPAELLSYLVDGGYPWVAARIRGETSRLGYALTFVNAGANLVFFAAWLRAAYRKRGEPLV